MKNPLTDEYSEALNVGLVKAAINGDRQALDQLILLHQPFIYNVAWKMAHDPNDALDLTQEVLLKVITKLGQFNFKSAFRTWLYRIVMNEFLMAKRRKREDQFSTFAEMGDKLASIPDGELTREEEIAQEELSKEMKFRCMSGMLMCLNREQRLIYIIGDIFAINHKIGGEIFGISPQNFRVKLHRSRKDLHNYMSNNCGLVNPDNPCRCPKKAKTLRELGALDPDNMTFNAGFKSKINAFAIDNADAANDAFADKVTALFRSHPARVHFDKRTIISEVLENDELMRFFDQQ